MLLEPLPEPLPVVLLELELDDFVPVAVELNEAANGDLLLLAVRPVKLVVVEKVVSTSQKEKFMVSSPKLVNPR